MTRVVLVGQAPGKPVPGATHVPLFFLPKGCAGANLFEMMGCSQSTYARKIERVNVFRDWPGRDARGTDRFPMAQARHRAALMFPKLAGAHVLLVGARPAAAFCFDVPPLEWITGAMGTVRAARVPHPSGRNRQFNDPLMRGRTQVFLADFGAWCEYELAGAPEHEIRSPDHAFR